MNLVERSIHNHNALKLKQEIEKKRKCIDFRLKHNDTRFTKQLSFKMK